MKKLNLSPFDLGVIVAFVAIGVLGFAAYWVASAQLATAQQEVSEAARDFNKYTKQQVFLPSPANNRALETTRAALQAELEPVVRARLQPPGNKLASMIRTDTIQWKADLDKQVATLTTTAKVRGVTLPPGFYFGFSRYLSQNPAEEATIALGKQLLAIGTIANILVDAPVKGVSAIRRTYDEDREPDRAAPGNNDKDRLPGTSLASPGGAYTAYPFELEFEASPEAFRTIVTQLVQSPYVFVIRTVSLVNSRTTSPLESDLETLAGATTANPGVAESGPGEAAAAAAKKPDRGPQYLFGGESIKIRLRLDLIEWHGVVKDLPAAGPGGPANGTRPAARRPRPVNTGGNE